MNNQTDDFYRNFLPNTGRGGDVWDNKPMSPSRYNNALGNTGVTVNAFETSGPNIQTLNTTSATTSDATSSSAPATTAAKAPCGCGGDDHSGCTCDKKKRAAYFVSGLLVGIVAAYFLIKK